jgi:hypothetical protein
MRQSRLAGRSFKKSLAVTPAWPQRKKMAIAMVLAAYAMPCALQ